MLVEIVCGSERLMLAVYYNPPNVDCSETLLSHLSEFTVKYKSTFFIGDFNTDPRKICSRSRRFREALSNASYNYINSEPTFFYQSGCSMLDLLITDDSPAIHRFDQVSMPGISNHDLIVASLNFYANTSINLATYRDYVNFNAEGLFESFHAIDWSYYFSVDNPNILLDILNNNLKRLHNNFFPLRKIRPKINPWFSDEIELALVTRDIAYRTWKRTKCLRDQSNFKRLRNKATQLIRKAKEKYERRIFDVNAPPKRLWKSINNLGLSKNSSKSIPCEHSADDLNDYFSSNYTTDSRSYEPVYTIPSFTTEFSFRPFEDFELVNAIFSINSNAVGTDEIPIKFLKIILPLALSLFNHLFNKILSTSIFPMGWKTVRIIPIKKKSNLRSISNYRPISILSALSKAFEKLCKEQITVFVKNFNLLNPFQSGFRSNHSTQTALLKVHDDIAKTIDKKGVAILLLIDFAKAFDRVSHSKLLKKLSMNFSFSISAVNLINSYLSER